MRTRAIWGALLSMALCAVGACSLIVKPSPTPQLCSGPGAECAEGQVCEGTPETGYRCVATCENHEQCVEDYPSRPFCDAEGRCVECLADVHCESGSDGGYCLDGACMRGCTGSEQCPEEWPNCNPDGRCVECTESFHCPVGEHGAHCVDYRCEPGCDGSGCCCPEFAVCTDGACLFPEDEECDGRDNDLDGDVDEGFDVDGDGYSDCVHVPPSGDCDDDDRNIHPGATETCNGEDDDCDGQTDEGTCSGGEVCDPEAGLCIARECETTADCTGGRICVIEVGQCEERAEWGEPCVGDSQCREGRCLTVEGLGVTGDASHRCTELCCNEFDCPADNWCADAGTGLKVCAPRDWHSSIGGSCGSRDECPACQGSRCLLQCCSSAQCSGGDCQIATATTPAGTEVDTSVCDARSGGNSTYVAHYCGRILPEYCNSGIRFVVEETFLGAADTCVCTTPCCRDADCTDGGALPDARCVLFASGEAACYPSGLSFVYVSDGATGSFDAPTGAAFGEMCLEHNECASNTCHPGRYCTRLCCGESDCPGGYSCRPHPAGTGRYANACVRDE